MENGTKNALSTNSMSCMHFVLIYSVNVYIMYPEACRCHTVRVIRTRQEYLKSFNYKEVYCCASYMENC